MSEVECPNCGCAMRGSPCSVCGYVRRRPAVYPIRHDPVTDAYQDGPTAGTATYTITSNTPLQTITGPRVEWTTVDQEDPT